MTKSSGSFSMPENVEIQDWSDFKICMQLQYNHLYLELLLHGETTHSLRHAISSTVTANDSS